MRLAAVALPLLAVVAIAAGCAPKRVLGPYAGEVGGATPGAAAGRARGEEAARGLAAAQAALALVGVAYRAGGETPAGGFDCSGFVRHVYRGRGVVLPRTAAQQAAVARPVTPEGLSPGDLVFFRLGGRQVSHVGIYVGDGRFAHAPKPGRRVRLERLDDVHWSARYAGARRP